jgi:hypothetical protein
MHLHAALITRLKCLLLQARAWFSPHPGRDDAVSVEADPREVQRWMTDTDRALLDEGDDASD